MLAKPSAVIAPLLAATIDLLILRRPLRRVLLPVGLWLILAIPFVLIGRYAQPGASLPFIPPLWARPVIALDALAFYLKQLVLPLHLGIDYGRSPPWLWHSRQIWFTWVVPVMVLAAAIVWDRAHGRVGQDLPSPGTPGEGRVRVQSQQASSSTRSAVSEPSPGLRPTSRGGGVPGEVKAGPRALASCLLFGAALLPTLGLVPFDFQTYSTVTDHYLYLPMLAPALLLAAILAQRRTFISVIVAAVICSALAVQTLRQIRHWRDSDALFSHALDVNPDSLAANVNYGNLLYDFALSAGRARNMPRARQYFMQAIPCYQRALLTAPNDCDARVYLGNTFFALNRVPEAIEQYEFALRLDPHDSRARAGLAAAQRRHPPATTRTRPAGPG